MRTVFLTVAQVLGLVLLADFLAGVVHWLEDAYGTEDTPVVGPLLIRPNIVHHHYPRFFTRLTWWQSSWDLLLLGGAILSAAWCFGVLSWQLWLFVAISINANQVHKWSHRTRKENGRVISFLQDIHLLQTPHHHALHHTDPKNTFYCPITNLVNPVLERIQFWPKLESLIASLTGLRHREDTSNRGSGPGPEWLVAFRPARPSTPVHSPSRSHATACDCTRCPTAATCDHHRRAA